MPSETSEGFERSDPFGESITPAPDNPVGVFGCFAKEDPYAFESEFLNCKFEPALAVVVHLPSESSSDNLMALVW
ncbi:unnamed protein product [Pseudo-nitzschia multistriata]|uniref:Uncharacterized protein n=1 Tax=Pseudo-nitzschia multistriata TaxID=183589 RepID=A0A448ZEF9_9STRA|nr:unnamed protein product [Pseudo-nitzschia multistriata]